MSLPEGIKPWDIDHFRNAHENFTQQLDPGQSLDLHIQSSAWDGLSSIEKYNRCTSNLQWVIQQALDKLMAIRAMGSGWSLSKVAVCDDMIINTKRLRLKFRLSENSFDQNYLDQGNLPDNHRFLQCGNTIIAINNYLENQGNPPKSLRASGGSNGQTIVGAFSTNTHGAALHYGALPEMILGIHIVTGPDRHVYIERASRRVTSQRFHDLLGAEVIIDDDLFNAALVSFGSFGIIHGVLVEVEDKFLLEQKLRRVKFDDALTKAATTSDFSDIESHLKYPLNDADIHSIILN
jgi:FAD/FMN-containing dehydrogenase